MKELVTTMIIAATLGLFAAGCASYASSGSIAEADALWCERGGGRWRPALGVCEPPTGDR